MAKQTITLNVSTERELTAALRKLSRDNPGKAVTAFASFGTVRAYLYDSLARVTVDSPDSRQMLATYGALAFVNGELQQPTRGWQRQQIAYDLRNHD